ncbi:monocarboxylate transporter 10-like isoform X2 [Dermacentor andersoni]|uniref:monocarboxylate transporter 10-like isoform X2 n=1 Tax=Dermacentor andersoni TaxID=34620 RepID=UPI002417C4FB|nr:monocarboxylate transporter 10-like isoform X2 [Dermacentor andersoni]
MIPLELCGALLDERRRSSSVPRPLSAPACLNHMSQECPEFAHLCCARRHHQCQVGGASRDKQEQDAAAAVVKAGTIRQHYYPEGGWGWTVCACGFLVHLLSDGLLASHGFMIVVVQKKFRDAAPSSAHGTGSAMKLVCLGAVSTAVALFLSPAVVGACRRKSTRMVAVLGGLVAALGCLFSSFASQFHQLFISYGLVLGCGVAMTRDTSMFMVGQYFKKRRELVELLLAAGTGLGVAVVPIFIVECIRVVGWRLGLQALTGTVLVLFVLGVFYRPASLYHPQRRAILHLKSMQRRSKAKDRGSQASERPPFIDYAVLRSRTVQILVAGTALAAFGVTTPLVLLMHLGEQEGLERSSLLLLQAFLGIASAIGSAAFGLIVIKNSVQCLIARQYLCQAAAFMISASLLAFTALHQYHGYLLFVWIYGVFLGGYQYSLKMYTLEKVRARNFAKTWSFVQWCQSVPVLVGVPLAGLLNEQFGGRTGFYVSSACSFLGAMSLFLIDLHKKRSRRSQLRPDCRRCSDAPPAAAAGDGAGASSSRRSSFQDSLCHEARLQQRSFTFSNYADLRRQELTCISEEAIMDNFLEDFIDDCITSCNKEEKYLMLSEYENNLNKTQETLDRRVRGVRRASIILPYKYDQCPSCMRLVPVQSNGEPAPRSSPRRLQKPSVDVIEEVTTSL